MLVSLIRCRNGRDTRYFLPFLQFWINLATHDVIRLVFQNPFFSKTWCRVSSSSFTNLASASVSLLGLVFTIAGHISGLDSQFGPFSQISRRSLDRVPLLPTSAGFWPVPTYSRLPITRTFKGNRKKVQVIGSSMKVAESNVKNSFYCTVNILITFNCRNVK